MTPTYILFYRLLFDLMKTIVREACSLLKTKHNRDYDTTIFANNCEHSYGGVLFFVYMFNLKEIGNGKFIGLFVDCSHESQCY